MAKALVRTKVKSRSNDSTIVQNSIDFYNTVKVLMPNVTVLHISNNEIIEFIDKEQPWVNVNNVKGIRNVHSITCKDDTHVQLWSYAKSIEPVFETWYTDT